jgi:hypothetical protein
MVEGFRVLAAFNQLGNDSGKLLPVEGGMPALIRCLLGRVFFFRGTGQVEIFHGQDSPLIFFNYTIEFLFYQPSFQQAGIKALRLDKDGYYN